MHSYLITGHFIVANKTGTVSPQNGMQRYKRYATAVKKRTIQLFLKYCFDYTS